MTERRLPIIPYAPFDHASYILIGDLKKLVTISQDFQNTCEV